MINAHDSKDLVSLGDAVYLRAVGEDRKNGLLVIAENGQEIYLSSKAIIKFVEFLETGLMENRGE